MAAKSALPALGPVDFPTLGWQVVDWIERFLRHGPGPVAGDRIELDDQEVRHLCWAYRLRPDTGRRVFRRVIRVAPKGRRKSEIAGAVVCVEALGPCRFDHWAAAGEVSWWGYEYEEGEPVGAPLAWPKIRCLATEEDQAGNTYDNVYEMLRGPEVVAAFPGLDVGLTRTFLPGGGEITPSTSAGHSKEGGGETFAVFDEPHLYFTPQTQNMHRTVSRNIGKTAGATDGWRYETTNSFLPGQNSVLERAHDHAVKAGSLDGMVKSGVLYDHVQPADPVEGDDWDDDEKVKAAIRDVYGPASAWISVDAVLAEIRDPESTEPDARRYWLNQVVAGAESWISLASWDRWASAKRLESGDRVALGFDGSLKDDATVLVACRLSDGLVQVIGFWERPLDSLDAWQVDTADVDAAVRAAFAEYDVVRAYCDPFFWRDYIDRWTSEFGDERVIEWPTNKPTRMHAALERVHTAVMTEQAEGAAPAFAHTGDDRLRRHVGNAHRVQVPAGYVISKRRKHDPRKIDAAMAMTLAYECRGDCVAAGLVEPDDEPSEFYTFS